MRTPEGNHLRLQQAADYLNIHKSTLWRISERDPSFPPKIRVGARLCYYRKSDLDEWLAHQDGAHD